MKLSLDYEELGEVLGYVNTVLSDKTVDEKMKNIIFDVNDDEVRVIGYSPLTFSRTKLTETSADLGDSWRFQVKASELNKILGCYTSLSKTKVTGIEFEEADNFVNVIVHEEAIDEADSRMNNDAEFTLNNISILDSVKSEISIDFPEEVDSAESDEILLYLDSLFPLMSNDSGSSMSSKINFHSDYVFVLSSHTSSFFANKLPDSFKDLTLGYSSSAFLKKLCEGDVEFIEVKKTDKYLCIRSGMTEAFLKYQRTKIDPKPYVSRMSKDNGIVLNRLYLKDVLKRMTASGSEGVLRMVDGDALEVITGSFNQRIYLDNKKGEVDDLSFKISVPIFIKTIIGNDDVFPEELYLYFVKKGVNGYIMFVQDSTGGWFSTLQVRK